MPDAVALEPTGGGWLPAAGVAAWAGVGALTAWVAEVVAPAVGEADTWVKVVGAFVLGGGLYKLAEMVISRYGERKSQNVKDARQQRKDAIDEYRRVIEALHLDRESDRKLIHDLRGDLQAEKTLRAVAEAKLEQAERERDEARRQVEGGR